MNEFTMRFLIIGSIITILIGFGIWWFFIHSNSDRIAEENAIKFVKAVDVACETGQSEVYFELQQPFVASLKEKFEEGIDWIKKKLGLGGPEINIPVQTFNDPYYKIYWEYFPPEPPYYFGQGVLETAASIFAPWSEDLPWSSNFMLTLTFDSLFLGLDILGTEEVKTTIYSYGRKAANKLISGLEAVSPETFEKARVIWNAIEKGTDATIEKLGKAERIVVKGGKLVIEEGKFVGKVTAAYTVFCLITQDKTLGECLKEGVILGIGMDVTKIVVQKFVWPKVKEKILAKWTQTKNKFYMKLDEFKSIFSSSVDEEADEVISSLKESVGDKGWKYDESMKRFVASSSDEVAKENVINPLWKYAESTGYPDKIDDFIIVYEFDKEGNVEGIKDVIYDPKSLKQRISERITYPVKEKLGRLEEKIMSDKMLKSDKFSEIAEYSKEYFEENPEEAKKLLATTGVKVKDENEAVKILSTRFTRIGEEANKDLFFVVVEKNSKMEELVEAMERAEESGLTPREIWIDYLKEAANDPKEAKNLWNLLNGKRLRIKEDIEIFSRGTFGYMILRIQDLYTPLGATYWDRYFSYYGYPSLEPQREGFCKTQCEDGKICIQLGACVRE
ncbi:MAG: hypothetical protein ACP5F8_00585, partial [Candidatus Aenigmatarchaeota archaeon]